MLGDLYTFRLGKYSSEREYPSKADKGDSRRRLILSLTTYRLISRAT